MSIKGSRWKKHKYIALNNGKYIYPENMPKEEKIEPEDTAEESVVEKIEERITESKARNDKIDAQMKTDYENLSKKIDDWLSSTTFGKIRDMKIKDLIEMLKHDGMSNDEVEDFLAHYAKGQTSKNHKHIRIENGRYIYDEPVTKQHNLKSDIAKGQQNVHKKASAIKEKMEHEYIKTFDESMKLGIFDGYYGDRYSLYMSQNKKAELEKRGILEEASNYMDAQKEMASILLTYGKPRYYQPSDKEIVEAYEAYTDAYEKLMDAYDDTKLLKRIFKHSDEEEDFLSHHGIQGMKWGLQNGPPYPLAGSRMSAAEQKKTGVSKSAKEKYSAETNKTTKTSETAEKKTQVKKEPPKASITKSEAEQYPTRLAKASEVYANRSNYSNQELQAYINRVNLERQIGELAQKEYAAAHPVKTFLKKKGSQMIDRAVDNAYNEGMKYVKLFIEEAGGGKDYTGPSLESIMSNPSKYTTKQMQEAYSRQNTMDSIAKKMAEKEKEDE